MPTAPNDSANLTKSGLCRSVPYAPPNAFSRSRATLPYESFLKITVTTLIPYLTAVESSNELNMKPPSPAMQSTGRSGLATFAPSAVGNA